MTHFWIILVNFMTKTTRRKTVRYNSFLHDFPRSVAPELALSESFRMAHISALDIKNRAAIFKFSKINTFRKTPCRGHFSGPSLKNEVEE